jgi:putative membrane protein
MRNTLIAAALLCLMNVSAARADDNNPDMDMGGNASGQHPSGAMGTVDTSPEAVLNRIHAINQEEIDAGKLAKDNGSHAIQSYAEKLIKDHEAADKQVKKTAKNLKIDIKSPDDFAFSDDVKQSMQHNKEMMGQMKEMKGAEFDQKFLTMMSQGHQQALDFLSQAKATPDTAVRTLVAHLQPTIEQHKKMADHLMGKESGKVQGRR